MRATGRSARGTGLQSGLVFAHDFSEGRNPSRKHNPTAPPTTQNSYWTGLEPGSSYKWGKSFSQHNTGARIGIAETGATFAKQAMTVFYSGRWRSSGSSNPWRLGYMDAGAGINWSAYSQGAVVFMFLNTAGGFWRTDLQNMVPTLGAYFTVSVSWPAGEASLDVLGQVRCFRDGVKRTTAAVGLVGSTGTPSGRIRFGSYGNMPTEGGSEYFQMAMWTRQLSDAEHYAIHRDPGLVTRSTVGAGRSIPGISGNFIHQGGYSFSRGA